ncbi:MAG: HAMP domain-containing histidine kinase [Planctomycetes bacterium]|nr:HAMP domain-containing histidine kinase [Planctomycetota bacterium]
MASRSRLGLLFALTLAIPAALAAGGAWLLWSGTIERARAEEAEAERRVHHGLATQLQHELLAFATDAGAMLDLDQERRVCGPFPVHLPTVTPPTPGLAEQSAGSALLASDFSSALPWLQHAAQDSLTPEGWLAYARTLTATDRDQALATLEAAIARFADTRCGSLPFPLLAAFARAAIEPTPPPVEELRRLAQQVPAAAIPPVCATITGCWPQLASEPRLSALPLLARVASGFAAAAIPTAPARGPDDCILLPIENELAVVDAAALPFALDHAVAHLDLGTPIAGEATPLLLLLVADRVPQLLATPTSPVLTFVAHGSLALALLTFLAGNLLLWQLTRREVALTRLRSDFVDLVSHELRTPLAALSLRAEMLANGDVPSARQQHYLQTLHHDVRRLDDQVRQILDFARLQKGGRLRLEPLPARTVLADGVRSGRAALRLVGQQLDLDVPRQLPALLGDREVLVRALRNLLENAAKYAPPGTTVDLRVRVHDHWLEIEIGDRGPGIPAAERAAIFQPFVRGSAVPHTTSGSGLGLALVAAAARAHSGSIRVHERRGGGSVFSLSLPLAKEVAS